MTDYVGKSGIFLTERTQDPDLCLVARNDEHFESMANDQMFMQQCRERNDQYNRLENLNNAELTKAGDNAAQNADIIVKQDEATEHWTNSKWRPAMGWMYFAVCICDFILFPMAWSIFQAIAAGSVTTPWQPITLQGAGLFHVAMGAVLGIAAYGRTREKIENATGASTKVVVGG